MRLPPLSLLFLQLGLGITFTWIGVDIVRHPDLWIGYVPPELPLGIERALALKINGAADILLGIFLIIGIWRKPVATLAALHLLAILFFQGIDAVLIRDFGLLGATLALFFYPAPSRRRNWRKFM